MFDSSAGIHELSAELQAVDHAFAVAVFCIDGTLHRANARFLQLFGYKAREVVGRPHAIFVPPQALVAMPDDDFWESLRDGKVHCAEHARARKDGTQIWAYCTYTPVRDRQGDINEVVLFVTDISARKLRAAEHRGQVSAIHSSQAVLHLAMDGTVTHANARFLSIMGFSLDEVVGANHGMFVAPSHAQHQDHLALWDGLRQGRHQDGVFKRIGKDQREVWLQATYTPILDMTGQPFKIVKYATDVTASMARRADQEGQIAAINKSHGVITFDMNGTVLDANAVFLEATGYRLDEIEGRHHRMFVDPSYAHGPEYAAFWNALMEGHHQSGEYRRVGKHGRDIWLQASYNPIHDLNGRPFKVVKYATVITREKLRQADHQGQIASIHKAQCVVSFALDGTILDANDNFLDATGYRLAEVRGRHHRMFVDEATACDPAYLSFWSDLSQGRHKAAEFKRRCKDGREIWLQASYNPIFDMNGRPFKVVKYATDITQQRLRQADNAGQIAAIHKSQCVVSFDMQGHVLEANDNFLAVMGYTLAEVQGQHHRLFVDEAFALSAEYATFWNTLRAGRFLSEKFKRVGRAGQEVWIQATYNPILDLDGKPFKVMKIATDITADVALAESFITARRQAEHDAGTGLPNRVGLSAFMNAALARTDVPVAVLFMDLDHFKPINDTFGHDVGDYVLRQTANRLREAIQPGQLVARLGGDEFVVVAPGLPDDQIDVLCQRLIDVVKAPIRHEHGVVAVGVSIGVALSPGDATTVEDLLRCADVALYRTKGNGREGYSFFGAAMNERLSATRHLAEEMRHGIKAGQFFLEFQPRFDARTGAMKRVEALVRWSHPERGRLEPADFIDLAEKSGLIVPLGEWVLRSACHAVMSWPGIGVAVNISPAQFAGTDLGHTVRAVLADTGLAPGLLELEMKESMLIDDVGRAATGLAALKATGVRLSLDDYGSHHTSLASLRAFPFDAVKIDRRFIADIEGEEGGRRIVEDVLRIGKALGVSVTAEGIETTGQLLMLDLDDVSEVQGFLLARPMSAAGIDALPKAARSR